MVKKRKPGPADCVCEYRMLGNPQKSSDVVTRRVRNPNCPYHGKADTRALRKRKRDEAVRTGGWR